MSSQTRDQVGLEPLIERLTEARERTLLLVRELSDDDLRRQHDVLMSPVLWDLGHIAHFERLWLGQNLDGEIRFAEMPGMYNPFEHPRRVRGELVYPSRAECIALMAEMRGRVLERLAGPDFDDRQPLLRDGFVLHMVLQHEYQHNETILQTLQLKVGAPYTPPLRQPVPAAAIAVPAGAMVRFPGGTVRIGTSTAADAYDNERPAHDVALPPFRIDVAPVRNADYLAFIEDGGYHRRHCWSDAGWEWRQEEGAEAPRYWLRREDTWQVRTMDRTTPIDPEHPVCHVSFHEAQAFASWTGKRLPTETEWEAAAAWDPDSGAAWPYPWGDAAPTPALANVDQLAFGTAPVGAYPSNVSPLGCYGMIGDVWEWTASDFAGYPGFVAFPYAEYSQAFFGTEYKVLRGGSWATRPGAIRNTFRNWDYPVRRQIFSGFRCACDD